MFELFVASDAARRLIKDSVEPPRSRARKPRAEPRRRSTVRASSAAALRSLADRLEPSPSA